MRAYRILAKNLKTRQRIERNPLSAEPITEEAEAWRLAHAMAQQQEKITGEQWSAEIELYETRG